MEAPVLVAKGEGFVARRIREIAEGTGSLWSRTGPPEVCTIDGDGDEIPEHCTRLSPRCIFIYRLKGRKAPRPRVGRNSAVGRLLM